MAQEAVDVAGTDILPLANARVKLFEDLACGFAGRCGPGQGDDVAMGMGLDPQPLLQQGQMTVVFSKQPIEMPVVFERHHQAGLLIPELLAQSGRPWPTHAGQRPGLLMKAQLQRISRLHSSTRRGLRRHAGHAADPRLNR
jgi:hypothetical protein